MLNVNLFYFLLAFHTGFWQSTFKELERLEKEAETLNITDLDAGDIYVGTEPPADIENWERDEDVMDTWFSSWLWPFATMNEMDLENKPLVFSCGSGMTACITLLAASLVLDNELTLYDGSWSEWGDGDADFPVA